jgi:hypothetical protein
MKQIIRRVAALVVGLGLGVAALAGLETVTHISDLNASWPLGSDLASTSDDHIRNIKTALKTDFPNITGPVTVTQAQLNAVGASGVTGAANPSASLGLSAVNGSATTFMRSDAAPALDQSIAPTWTGLHLFTGNATAGQIQIGASGAYSPPSVNRGVFNYDTGSGVLSIDARSNGGNTSMNLLASNAGTATTRISINGAAGITLATPPSGTALTVNSTSGGTAISATGDVSVSQQAASTGANITMTGGGSGATINRLRYASNSGANNSFVLRDNTNAVDRLTVSSSGNFSTAAPSSGVPLTIAGTSGTAFISAGKSLLGDDILFTGGNVYTTSTNPLVLGTSGAAAVTLASNGSSRISIGSAGNITANAPSSGVGVTASGVNGNYAMQLNGNSTTGGSRGLLILAGTNSSDAALAIANQPNTVNFLNILGDGSIIVGAPTGSGCGGGCLNAQDVRVNNVSVGTTTTGTFTGTFTGFASANTGTCTWTKTGNTVTLFMPATLATSNATTFTMTGLPSAIQPATLTQSVALTGDTQSGGSVSTGAAAVFTAASGTVTFHTGGGASNWASSSNKGWSVGTSVTYSVQ